MKHIVKYLTNPLQTGVYYSQLIVDFSALEGFLRTLAAIPTKPTPESKELIKIADSIKEEEYFELDEITENFGKAMAYFIQLKACPKEIKAYVFGKKEPEAIFALGESIVAYGRRTRYGGFRDWTLPQLFKSRILDDINDVVIIETEETEDESVLLLEITTTKEEGLLRFINFMKCVPHIGDTVKEIRKRKTYSSRYTFRPYPLAVQLWLENEKGIIVPEDLRDFLRGSVRYHSEEEWRTSIVLSAIAVESVLADLYEEEFKEYAPNDPLGHLYHKVKEKIDFPSNIKGAIEMVNEARISAVHRSRFPVSDREATNALYGSTTFIMWYSANY